MCRGRLPRSPARPGVRLAHTNREIALAARDGGQEPHPLLVCSVPHEERPGLALCEPVRGNRGACGEKLLGDDIPLHLGPVPSAVARWPVEANPAPLTETPAEGRRVTSDPRVARWREHT